MSIVHVFQCHIVYTFYISNVQWFVHVMGARQKLEHSVVLDVVVQITDILAEGETRLSRTGGVGGLVLI